MSQIDTPHTLETLDEPISATILRDVKKVGRKLKHVLIPSSSNELRNWDLWGPLFLCLTLAVMLSWTAPENQSVVVFASVFVIVWCGAGVVTLNALLLGGNISFFQSVCVLGYCIAPLTIASIGCRFWDNNIYQGVFVIVAFLWSTRASVGFMAELLPPQRKLLAVYPVLLFYLTIGWMIFIQ